MDKIRLALDVDGVLRNWTRRVSELYTELTGERVDPNDYQFWGWPGKYYVDGTSLIRLVFGDYSTYVMEGAEPYEYALEFYEELVENDMYEVYIATSQPKNKEHHTTNWLKNNGFDKHEHIYFVQKKLLAPCQVLIDDKYNNVKEYNENGRLGLLFHQPWNRQDPQPMGLRLESYGEILEYLETLQYGN